MCQPPFTPREIPGIEAELTPGATVGLEGLGQLKNPMTSLGSELVTFWLVAQCILNYQRKINTIR
jgi:hypothetical protein